MNVYFLTNLPTATIGNLCLQKYSDTNIRLRRSYLMETLRPQTPEVPHHVRVLQVGLRITLLRMDEGWELKAEKSGDE